LSETDVVSSKDNATKKEAGGIFRPREIAECSGADSSDSAFAPQGQ
jgi:hypothetical protein